MSMRKPTIARAAEPASRRGPLHELPLMALLIAAAAPAQAGGLQSSGNANRDDPARIRGDSANPDVENSGTITTEPGGIGVSLISEGADDPVTGRNSGTIVVAGGSTDDRSRGLLADGAGARGELAAGGAIILEGEGAVGAQAVNGGAITVAAGAGPVFSADAVEQIGFQVSKLGSTIDVAPGALEVTGTRSTLFRIDSGGRRTFDSTNTLVASGANSRAIVVANPDSSATLADARIQVSGDLAAGLVLLGGASGAADSATSIVVSGSGTAAMVNARPALRDGSTVAPDSARLASAATVTGAGDGARGYHVTNGGALTHTGTVTLTGQGAKGVEVLGSGAAVTHSGAITLTGGGIGVGVEIGRGGRFVNNGAVTVASGIGVLIRDAGSTLEGLGTAPVTANDGIAALQVIRGGSVDTAANFVGNGTAHGVLVDEDAGAVRLGAGTVTTGGTGNALENAAESSAIRLDGTTLIANGSGSGIRTGVALDPASTAIVRAAGANSTGFTFANAGGATTANDFTLGAGYDIDATGVGATGVRLATTGTATLGGTVEVTNAQGGSALVAGPAASVTNSGGLTSASTAAAVVDLRGGTRAFTNSGVISAPSASGAAIVGGDNGQSVSFTGGGVTGSTRLGAGADTFLMTGGAFAGAFDAGAGNDTATFRGLTDANIGGVTAIAGAGAADGADVLTFDATTTTGTRRITGWNDVRLVNGTGLTSDGDLVMAGGGVTIDATSTFFAGNGALGAITPAAGGTLTVTNAGVIDLTNGGSGATDTLTIRGNYAGQGGTLRLQTQLGSDASPTDRLIIDGGTVTGTTAIQITNVGGLGALTTGDGIEVVSGINGASTTATTTRDGFTLAGGVVAAGAFEYRLYASDLAGTGQGWYLRTQAGSGQTEVPGGPTPPTTFRPAVALLSGLPNFLRSGDLAMVGTYHERMGDETGVVGQGYRRGRIWGRVLGEEGDFRQRGDVRPLTDGRLLGFQIGADLFRFGGRGGHHDVGVYGGYLDGDARVNGFASGVQDLFVGRLRPDATYAGVYWTFIGDRGFYVDTVVQRSWYGGRAEVSDASRLNIDGTGILASVEAGYGITLASNWTLEPQAQLIAQNVSLDDLSIPGAEVRQKSDGQITGRLGLRAKGRFETSGGDSLQPYFRANLWRGFASTDRAFFATPAAVTVVRARTSSLWGEVGSGLTWSLSPRFAIYGEADYRFDLDGSRGVVGDATSASVGLKISL